MDTETLWIENVSPQVVPVDWFKSVRVKRHTFYMIILRVSGNPVSIELDISLEGKSKQ